MRDTILIVEDDEMICQGIVDALQLRNWKTDVAATCEEAEKKIKEYTYMLYILDMKLPDGNGIALCRKIRTATENPVLFLSAYDNESYIVEGLEAGGDDYVVKPFRVAELVPRIMANVRRISGGTDIYKDGTLTVDFKNKSIIHADKQICVSPTEFHVLEILINNKGLIVRRDTFFQKMWDRYGTFVEDNTLTVTVSRLKTKLGNREDGRAYIETIRGIGYRWKIN